MKLTIQEIRHIIKDEISEFFDPRADDAVPTQEPISPKTAQKIQSLGKEAKKIPHLASNIDNLVKKITQSGNLKKDLGKVVKNPVGAAQFITQLMSQMGLTPQAYTHAISQITETKQNYIISILNNCNKLIKKEGKNEN